MDGRKRTNIDAGDHGFAKITEIAAGICERTARRRGKNRKNRPENGGFWDAGGRSEWSTTRCRQSVGWRGGSLALAEGFSKMEIEIVRAENPNGHRQLLHDWYTRLNYIKIATFPIIERIPEIAGLQKQTCINTVYRKLLS